MADENLLSTKNAGGVDASIPLAAGRMGQQSSGALNPLQFIGAMQRMQELRRSQQLLPGELTLQQQGISKGDITLGQQKAGAAANYLRTLFGKPNVSHDDVVRALGAAEGVPGVDTAGLVKRFAGYEPGPDGNYAGFVNDQLLPTMSESGALTAISPVMRQISAGGRIVTGVEQPLASGRPGQFVPQGQVGVTLTPAEKVVQQSVLGPDNQPGTRSVGTAFDDYGNQLDENGNIIGPAASNPLLGPLAPTGGLGAGPGGGGQQGAAAPQSGVPIPGGSGLVRYPDGSVGTPRAGGLGGGGQQQAQPPAQQAAPAQGAQRTQPRGFTPTSAVPGTVENMEKSALAAHAANDRARSFASDMYPLLRAQTALQTAGTGKGSEVLQDINSMLQTFNPIGLGAVSNWLGRIAVTPFRSPEQIAAYDEARKYLTQVSLGVPGSTRSNEGLATGTAASPSVSISPAAAQVVLRGMIGLRRMEHDATLAFNASGLPPAAYDRFTTDFNTRADPRVYVFDQMTPKERGETLDSFKTDDQRNAFKAAVSGVEQRGLLSPPGQQQQQQR